MPRVRQTPKSTSTTIGADDESLVVSDAGVVGEACLDRTVEPIEHIAGRAQREPPGPASGQQAWRQRRRRQQRYGRQRRQRIR